MKPITPPGRPVLIFEINSIKFKVEVEKTLEAARGEIKGMPLPHFVYIIKAERLDKENTTPLRIEYHGGFSEWARGKPAFSKVRAINAFADYMIDAAIYLTRKPEDLLEAYAMDTDMANKTWLGLRQRYKDLNERFRMTSSQIITTANVLHKLQIDGRLNELIPGDGQ